MDLFSNIINQNAINNLSIEQCQQIADMFTSSETKAVMAKVKSGVSVGQLSTSELKNGLDIKCNSVGWYCDAVDGIYYDLIDLAENLMECYQGYCPIKAQMSETLYYRCLDEIDDNE